MPCHVSMNDPSSYREGRNYDSQADDDHVNLYNYVSIVKSRASQVKCVSMCLLLHPMHRTTRLVARQEMTRNTGQMDFCRHLLSVCERAVDDDAFNMVFNNNVQLVSNHTIVNQTQSIADRTPRR